MSMKAIALLLVLSTSLASSVLRPSQLQSQLAVTSIDPANGATDVPINKTIRVKFNTALIPESVNARTFLVTNMATNAPISGSTSASANVATFVPSGLLPPAMPIRVRIVGGPFGVRGTDSMGIFGETAFLPADFISTFTTGQQTSGGQSVSAQSGGTVTESRTGAAATIPRRTLKVNAKVKVLTLDTSARLDLVDRSCDVALSSKDTFPEVRGFMRLTEVVRFEVQPCGANAFGPGMTLKLPLLAAIKGLLPIGTPLRLFQLGRTKEGTLVFRDTRITVKVSGGFITGSFATVPAIQSFGTYAGFSAVPSGATRVPEARSANSPEVSDFSSEGGAGGKLYFPAVVGDPTIRKTKLSIANPDPTNPLTVTLTSYDSDGVVQHTETLAPILGGRQTSVDASSLFPSTVKSGSVVAESAMGSFSGFSEIADNYDNPTFWASAEAVKNPQSVLIFPVVEATATSFSEIHIFVGAALCGRPSAMFDGISLGPVKVKLTALKSDGTLGDLEYPSGTVVSSPLTLDVNPCGRLVIGSSNAPISSRDVILPSELNGGYLVAQALDGETLVGTELFGVTLDAAKQSLAMLNGFSFPSGCGLSDPNNYSCQADASIPEVNKQRTLYAPYFESGTIAELIVVNTSSAAANLGLSAFNNQGAFLGQYPTSATNPFLTLQSNEVIAIHLTGTPGSPVFPFSSPPAYVRVEDPDAALIGVLIIRDSLTKKYQTVIPLVPDIPELAQSNSDSFLSRIQLDPSSVRPVRITTGFIILNPNNNTVPLTVYLRESTGTRRSSVQSVVARGVFNRARLSSSVLFSSSKKIEGYIEIVAAGALTPGTGGRVIVIGTYRSIKSSDSSTNVISTVMEQAKAP